MCLGVAASEMVLTHRTGETETRAELEDRGPAAGPGDALGSLGPEQHVSSTGTGEHTGGVGRLVPGT